MDITGLSQRGNPITPLVGTAPESGIPPYAETRAYRVMALYNRSKQG